MIYDIRTIDSALKFLEKGLMIERNVIYEAIKDRGDFISLGSFYEELSIEKTYIKVESIKMLLSHVTTTIDENEFLLKYGLVNLQDVLQLDSPLNRFINKHQISFDFKEKIIICGNESYSINRTDYKNHHGHGDFKNHLKELSRKIYADHQISAFLTMEGDTAYLGEVHARPEILRDISNVSKINLSQEWYEISKPQVVEFYVNVSNVEPASFDLRNEHFMSSEEYKNYIENWLVEKAINTIWNISTFNRTPENIVYVNYNHIIDKCDMKVIRDIEN